MFITQRATYCLAAPRYSTAALRRTSPGSASMNPILLIDIRVSGCSSPSVRRHGFQRLGHSTAAPRHTYLVYRKQVAHVADRHQGATDVHHPACDDCASSASAIVRQRLVILTLTSQAGYPMLMIEHQGVLDVHHPVFTTAWTSSASRVVAPAACVILTLVQKHVSPYC